MRLAEGQAEPNFSIHKAGGILVQDRKIVVTRTIGKDIFINPGGKLKPGETVADALVREHMEELGIVVDPEDCEPFGVYYAEAAYDPGNWVKLEAFLVNRWSGEISPQMEVEEVARINSGDIGQIALASIVEGDIIPDLVAKGIID